MKIRAIALNTFKEAIRDRILYLLLFFAAVCLLMSRVLSLLTVGDPLKIIRDVGLSAISLFGMLMAILIGTLELFDFVVAAVAIHTSVKMMPGQMLHELRDNRRAYVHPGLPFDFGVRMLR